MPRTDIGPGCWRLNPHILQNKAFQAQISQAIRYFFAAEMPGRNTQQKWEDFKLILKYATQGFCKEQSDQHKNERKQLHQERARMIKTSIAMTKDSPEIQTDTYELTTN